MLDARRLSAMQEDKHIKMQEILAICVAITLDETKKTIEAADRKVFNSKHRITSLMLGRMNEIIKETQKTWIKFLGENRGFFTSLETKIDTVDTPVEGKGKEIMGTPPSILKNIKILEIEPPVNTNIQTNTKTLVDVENIV